MTTFDDVLREADELLIYLDDGEEVTGYFEIGRVDRKTVPENMFVYEVRENSDGSGDLCTLENYVDVNFAGTFITLVEIDLGMDEYLDITESYSFM